MAIAHHSGAMRIEVVKHVRRPLSEVYAWCTDFRESDRGLSIVAIRSRRVLSRSPDRVEFEDEGVLGMSGVVRYAVRLHPPDAWEADLTSRMGMGHDEYKLSPEGDTTKISVTFTLRPRGLYRIPGAFARPFLRRRLERLWDDFVRHMEERT